MKMQHLNCLTVLKTQNNRLHNVILKVLACPYFPQRCVQLMDDDFHLLTASKSHDSVIASKRTGLGEVGHWVERHKNIYSRDKCHL